MWKPFVERDWPYFRRNRAKKLKMLAQVRPLSQVEMAELDAFTFDELRDTLNPVTSAGTFSSLRADQDAKSGGDDEHGVDESFVQLETRNVRPIVDDPFIDARL
eukprot:TRINITY_DN29421_c0_g1_i1.p1 TRINITY_DN29421_c0_g1~~TRINITY_DN29421_c0_g1_i1.p1  ORF type:complete len:104 (-),score=7.84 TRINITY_DN29421_c0_g1_i1:89-400(-)